MCKYFLALHFSMKCFGHNWFWHLEIEKKQTKKKKCVRKIEQIFWGDWWFCYSICGVWSNWIHFESMNFMSVISLSPINGAKEFFRKQIRKNKNIGPQKICQSKFLTMPHRNNLESSKAPRHPGEIQLSWDQAQRLPFGVFLLCGFNLPWKPTRAE